MWSNSSCLSSFGLKQSEGFHLLRNGNDFVQDLFKPFANMTTYCFLKCNAKRYKMRRSISIVSKRIGLHLEPRHSSLPGKPYYSVCGESLLHFKHWRKILRLAYAKLVWINVLVDSSLPCFCSCFHRYLNADESLSTSGPLTLKTASVERQLQKSSSRRTGE